MTNFLQVKNNSQSLLNGAVDAVQTTWSVIDVSQFPSVYPFHLTINNEIVSVTNSDFILNTITVVRAQENTINTNHDDLSPIYLFITAGITIQIQNAINAIENAGYITQASADLRYLGINAQASDSAKLGGQLPSYYYQASNPSGYISGITSLMVTNALGYTPVTNARTITINGVTHDLTTDRSWTVTAPMVYPTSNGIVTYNGSGWGNSISGTSAQFVKGDGSFDNTVYVSGTPWTSMGYITLSSLSAGTGISYNNLTGVITNSLPDQIVSFTGGTNITIGGTYPSFTVSDSSISKSQADTYYYPLSTNPAGYLTSSSLSGYVPYTGATTDVDLGTHKITATSFIKSGGTSSQFLKADGSVDSSTYLTADPYWQLIGSTLSPLSNRNLSTGIGTFDAYNKLVTVDSNGFNVNEPQTITIGDVPYLSASENPPYPNYYYGGTAYDNGSTWGDDPSGTFIDENIYFTFIGYGVAPDSTLVSNSNGYFTAGYNSGVTYGVALNPYYDQNLITTAYQPSTGKTWWIYGNPGNVLDFTGWTDASITPIPNTVGSPYVYCTPSGNLTGNNNWNVYAEISGVFSSTPAYTSISDYNGGYNVDLSWPAVTGATQYLIWNTSNSTWTTTTNTYINDSGSGWTSGAPTVTPSSPATVNISKFQVNSVTTLVGSRLGVLPIDDTTSSLQINGDTTGSGYVNGILGLKTGGTGGTHHWTAQSSLTGPISGGMLFTNDYSDGGFSVDEAGVTAFFGSQTFFSLADRNYPQDGSHSGGFYKVSGVFNFWNNVVGHNTFSVADNGDVAIDGSSYGTYSSNGSSSNIPSGFYVNKNSLFNGLLTSNNQVTAPSFNVKYDAVNFATITNNINGLVTLTANGGRPAFLFTSPLQGATVADRTNLGTEKLTDPTTPGTSANWTRGAAWQNSSGNAQKFTNGTSTLSQTAANMVTPPVIGETYLLRYTVSGFVLGFVTPSCGGVTLTARTANGIYEDIFTATSAADLVFTPGNTSRLTVGPASLKKIIGGNLNVANSVYAKAFITQGGTATQFVKGDGSLDSTTYITGVTNTTLTQTGSTLGLNLANANTWTGQQTFVSTSALTVGLIAKGYASQTADLQEWQDSTGAVLAKVGALGGFTVPNISDTALTMGRITMAGASGLLQDNANLTWDTTYGLKAQTIYGSMYADNVSQTITIGVIDTSYQVGANLTGGSTNGFTFQNARELKCLVEGKYLVTWSMSLQSSSNNQEAEGFVLVNYNSSTHAGEQVNTSNHSEIINGGKPTSVSGSGIITLSVNDLVSLGVNNHTGANNIIMNHANLTIERLDN